MAASLEMESVASTGDKCQLESLQSELTMVPILVIETVKCSSLVSMSHFQSITDQVLWVHIVHCPSNSVHNNQNAVPIYATCDYRIVVNASNGSY